MDIKLVVQRTGVLLLQPPIAKGLTILAVTLALYHLSQISWQLLPAPKMLDAAPWQGKSTAQNNTHNAVSILPLTELKLFGDLDAREVEPEPVVLAEPDLIKDAPKTSLRILLTGLVASNYQQKGIAIIEHSGQQDTYGVEDEIKGTKATLHEVYADRAIILNQGRYETLMLDGVEFSREISSHTEQLRRPQSQSSEPTQSSGSISADQVQDIRNDLLDDPAKLTDYLSISPVRKDGEVQGYRLNPGRNRELFTQSGLKANDLAISMNGYDLTNMAESMQLMAELEELTDLSVTVERDGQLTEITLGLPK